MSEEVVKDYSTRDYRTVWQHSRALFEDRFEGGIIKRLLSPDPGWFIDIGAGYGRLYPICARPQRKVVLVDYAPHLLEMAVQSYGDRGDVYFIAANAYHLPFRDQTFSAGISVRVFHHMNDPKKFFTECARVLRESSHLLLEYSNKRNVARLLKRPRRSLNKNHEEYGDLLFGTHPQYFKEVAQAAGLQVESTTGTGFFPRFITKKTLRVAPLLSIAERVIDALLGPLELAPMHFTDLKKKSNVSPHASEYTGATLADILQCPACGGSLTESELQMLCTSCHRSYPRIGKVFDFRYTAE